MTLLSRHQLSVSYHFLISMYAVLLFSNKLTAQHNPVYSDDYTLIHYNASNGLPQNTVPYIAQTPDGFMWFGTFGGLVRFDGHSFKNYGLGEIKNLKSDFILHLFVDSKGNVWSITDEEIIYINKNTVLKLDLPNEAKGYIKMVEAKNRIYLLINNCIYDIMKNPSGLACAKIYETKPEVHGMEGNADGLYIFKHFTKICKITNDKEEVLIDIKAPIKLIRTTPHQLFFSANNVFYEIVSKNNYHQYKSFSKEAGDKATVRQYADHKYFYLKHETLHIVDLAAKTTGKIILTNNEAKKNEIVNLFDDKEGHTWILSSGGGVYLLYPKVVKTLSHVSANKEARVAGGFFVYEDPGRNNIWINAKGNNLVKIKINEPDCLKWNYYPLQVDAWSMLIDDQQHVWVGQLNLPLAKYDSLKAPFKQVSLPGKSIYNNKCIFQTKDKTIWFETADGLFATTDYIHMYSVTQAGKLKNIHHFAEDSTSGLWIASKTGLGNYAKKQWSFFDKTNGLPTNDIRCVYPDKEGAIWIGTAGFGLCRLKNGKIFHYPLQDEQLNKNIWAIVEDDYGYLWMSCNQGIYCVNKQDLNHYSISQTSNIRTYHYLENDGLENVEFNSRTQNKGFKDRYGYIWFSSIVGPARVNAGKAYEERKHQQTKIVIDAIEVNGIQRELSQNAIGPLNSSQTIKVKFTAPSFYGQHNIHFQYLLEGFDEHWNDANERVVQFTKLPPGLYTFRLRIVGTELTAFFKMTVQPRLWQYAIIKYLAIFLIMLFPFFITLRIKKNRQRKLAIENEKELELSNLKLSLVQAQMNPHFIYNVLGSIQSYVGNHEAHKASDYIAKFARLIRITLNRAQNKDISLEEEINRLNLYLELEKLRHGNRLNYIIEIQEHIDQKNLVIPNMLIQPLLENAIIHGILQLPKTIEGLITLIITTNETYLTIIVKDNGQGFEPNSLSKHGYKSIGLLNVKQRIQSIKGASFSIDNKKNVTPDRRGTIVTIVLPLVTT